MRGSRPWSRWMAVAVPVVCLVVAAVAPTGPVARTTPDAGVDTYVVRADTGALPTVLDLLRAGNARVDELSSLEVAVADLTPAQAADLADEPGVVSVTRDASLHLASSTYDAKSDVDSMYNIATVIGARDVWGRVTGRGVDIAVIDSGVAPVAGLDEPGKVVHGPDLSFESQSENVRHLDTFGHGTHMAGIIAGRDRGTDPARTIAGDAYLGVAPDARIVSIKVADAHGATDVSQVLAAIDWVVQHRRAGGLDVRVLNLSFSTSPRQPYDVDPLAHAAEVAWRNGIVVVTSAGNDGSGTGSLGNPAYNPRLLAVGAVESNGTRDTADDVIPSWSSRGAGGRNPDLVAPGAHVQGLRVPGSFIDAQHGSGPGSIDARYLRGSGTSQAAAVVSGAAALLLQQRPTLTPDQVKHLLETTASVLPAADPQASGSGLLNVKRALQAATPTAVQQAAPSRGTGSLDAARGGNRLERNGVVLRGEQDIFGKPYDAAVQAEAATTLTSWSGGTWNGSTWTGASWNGASWDGASWNGASWDGASWDGASWNGASWNGASWNGASWNGASWNGASWNGASWNGASWNGASWDSERLAAAAWSGASGDSSTWATSSWG